MEGLYRWNTDRHHASLQNPGDQLRVYNIKLKKALNDVSQRTLERQYFPNLVLPGAYTGTA